MANKAYKFRLYPTQEQEQLLAKTFGCVRFVYNKMLAERKETSEQFKDDKEALKKQKFPTPAKYKKESVWLKEVDSLALANAQLNLQKAYQNFFSGRAEFPKFKSRKARQSYTTDMNETVNPPHQNVFSWWFIQQRIELSLFQLRNLLSFRI
jgi:putative transposase